ncbi:hypothetical protein [Paenibacillus aceris]|uniref:Uncharacterized protein n=1 Tax=Paenibacillus aceris TaxID=869555 RepID=A0ABS4I246_9BACL|nr:hypothetical protein [Paenibacillus aceris]MBP1964631.1 hypothetical protein [Paenibacillus aceris]NHW33620.1 hypothetical protein [Paenibacillus aceris]
MKFTAYWLFNIVLGIPTPFVMIYLIFGFYGFMAPSTTHEKYMAAGALLVYLIVWLFGNLLILRKEDRATRLGMLALSPLPIAITAYCSFKIIAALSS